MSVTTAQLESLKPEGYPTASTQVDLPMTGAVAGWAARHLEPHMVDQEAGGIEQNPHVTILYGLNDPDVSKVIQLGRAHNKPIKLTLGELDLFEALAYDVLFAKVHSPCLHSLRKGIAKLPNESRFPVYTPHMTVAYVKKGVAAIFKGQKPFGESFILPGFWLNLAQSQASVFVPTTGAFTRTPFEGELREMVEVLAESTGRRRPGRQMRLLYLYKKPAGVPEPQNEVEAIVDGLVRDVHQAFDWSAIYSGDKQQARIAADDLFQDVMNLAKVRISSEAAREDGLRFTLADVVERWGVLVRYARRSSELGMRAIRRRVRV